jgi:hypothetical protein
MTPVEVGGTDVKLWKYHLLVLSYFLLALVGQYLILYKYIAVIPSEYQGMLGVTMVVIYGFQALFMVALVPLCMVFIFSSLYLIDIKAKVKSLYPIVVTSLIPFLILMAIIAAYALLALEVRIEPTEDMQKLANLIKADIDTQLLARRPLFTGLAMVAGLASITMCAYQLHHKLALKGLLASPLQTWPRWMQRLHERYNLSPVIATLIPLSFAASLYLFQKLSGLAAGNVFEKLRGLSQP